MRHVLTLLLTLGAALLVAPSASHGEDIVADLSQNRVSITANFDGSEITVFGAIKREKPIPDDVPLDVIVTVEGPKKVETVRRKGRRAGIWINVDASTLGFSPTFYSVATSRPMLEDLPPLTNMAWSITADQRILPKYRGDEFREALLRLRTDAGLYQEHEGEVELMEDTLFRSSVTLPSNLTEGDYRTRIYLLRAGEVIDSYDTAIFVRKVGIERWLHSLAKQQPFFYGLLAVLVAIVIGWLASETFRILRRR